MSSRSAYNREYRLRKRAERVAEEQARLAAAGFVDTRDRRPCPSCGAVVTMTPAKLRGRVFKCHACRMKGRHGAAAKRWRERHPERERAHWAVRDALLSGRLVKQACERCGELKAEAHHPDYAKKLDVEWLCKRCHEREHVLAASLSPEIGT